MIRAAVITISDKGAAGLRQDLSGPLLQEMLRKMGAEIVHYAIIPDEREQIRELLTRLADTPKGTGEQGVELIITTGGTGPAPRDVTPEATLQVIEREMPGLAEVLRMEGYRKTSLAVISRGVAGIRGRTLIINLPGNPKAVREGMEVLIPILPHALQMLRGEELEHHANSEWRMKGKMTESYPMLSVEEAQERMLALVRPLEPEWGPLLEALGRVLAEDVFAGVDIPPLDNSAMDGYAIRAEDTIGASQDHPVRLRIIGNLAAGYTFPQAVEPGTAVRIMTGAPIPPGADTVIRFERARRDDDTVEILEEVRRGRNIRRAGEDVRRGELVLPRGTLLRPQEIGMLAALGRAEAWAIRRPRVAILATGEEVIPVDQPLAPGKIHDANSTSNAAQVLRYGGVPLPLGIARDRREELSAKIREGLEQGVDLFLTSGGVSVGDFDVVKEVLAAEGEIHFWWVNMKPGKPLAFGQIGGVPLLGLPGNPVAAMISFELFARPAILKMLGRKEWDKPTIEAVLEDAIERKDNRRHFLRVRVQKEDGQYTARLTGPQGSGILNSMVQANGLAIIPEERGELAAGERVQVLMLDWPEGVIL